MGFLGLRKAKWKAADAATRIAGINELTYEHQATFHQLASSDPDAKVRAAAARRVNEQRRLEQLLSSPDAEVVRLVRERLSSVAVKLASERPLSSCSQLITTMDDQRSLVSLTLEAKDPAVREATFSRLLTLPDVSAASWSTIAIQDADGKFALQALEHIEKRGALKDIVRKAKVERVRTAAQQQLEKIEAEADKPSPEQLRKARRKALEPLVVEAGKWAVSQDLERAEEAVAAIDKQRAEVLAQYSDVSLDDETKAADERIQRVAREVTKRAADMRVARQQAIDAHEQFLTECAQAEPANETDSAARRSLLEEQLRALPPIEGPEKASYARRCAEAIARLCPAAPANEAGPATEQQREIPEAVLTELEQVVSEAEALSAAERRLEARDRYRVLHKRWNHLIADLPQNHALRTRFLDAYGRFKEAGRQARTEREQRQQERLKTLESLAREAEAMAAQEAEPAERKARFEALRDLQKRWRAVGAIRPDLLAAVRERFRAACDTAFAPLKEFIEAEDWARFANLGNAENLIAEVEALSAQEDLAALAKSVKQLQQRWKDVGPLPGEKREATWQRFKAACDVVYARLQPYFAEQDQARQENLTKKLALVAEIEAINDQEPVGMAGSPADISQKRANNERMKAIQAEWKTIGPVPRADDKPLWSRFRAAGDAYYAKHRAEMDARHQEQKENLNQKLALCVAAEELANDVEAVAKGEGGRERSEEERLAEVKDLQKKFKFIGHVPRDQVEAIWSRFRTACDRVYATLGDHLAKIEQERQENLVKKQALIAEAEDILKHENARWFKDEVKDLQRRWREIGHVPRDQMETVGTRFKTLCDEIYALE